LADFFAADFFVVFFAAATFFVPFIAFSVGARGEGRHRDNSGSFHWGP
jgi:hypothetical protein